MSTPRSDYRLDNLSSPMGTAPQPSFRRTQSGSVSSLQNHIDVSSGIPWPAPTRAEEVFSFSTATHKPPHLGEIGRRATDAALQTVLDQMDLTARARQRQGPMGQGSMSAPLSPAALTPRAVSGWPQNDRQAIPPENRVYPERIAAGESYRSDSAHRAGLDTRTTIMVKDVPVRLIG